MKNGQEIKVEFQGETMSANLFRDDERGRWCYYSPFSGKLVVLSPIHDWNPRAGFVTTKGRKYRWARIRTHKRLLIDLEKSRRCPERTPASPTSKRI